MFSKFNEYEKIKTKVDEILSTNKQKLVILVMQYVGNYSENQKIVNLSYLTFILPSYGYDNG